MPLAVAVAFVLLAEAMIAVAFGRSWHATWWEWHVLMAIAFGSILFAAKGEYRRERSVAGTFGGLYLERTLERVDRRDSEVLGELVVAMRDDEPLAPVLERLRVQGYGADEIAMLERSARELSRVDALFRRYVGPRLADRLEEEPSFAQLGGEEKDVTVLFADLEGFTSFSEGRPAGEVIEMVNAYWEAAVPIVVEQEGGLIERFAGDAIMAVFNALDDQPDHPIRAARAGIAMRDLTERIAAEHRTWPRFRIGVNTGLVVIGNVGPARPAELRGDRRHDERRGSSPVRRTGRVRCWRARRRSRGWRRGGRASGRDTVAEGEGRGRRGIRAGAGWGTARVGRAGG